VSFEDALAASVANHDGHVAPTTELSLEPTRLDGNNVTLATETTSDIETGLRYRFAAQAMTQQFSSMQAAMRTS